MGDGSSLRRIIHERSDRTRWAVHRIFLISYLNIILRYTILIYTYLSNYTIFNILYFIFNNTYFNIFIFIFIFSILTYTTFIFTFLYLLITHSYLILRLLYRDILQLHNIAIRSSARDTRLLTIILIGYYILINLHTLFTQDQLNACKMRQIQHSIYKTKSFRFILIIHNTLQSSEWFNFYLSRLLMVVLGPIRFYTTFYLTPRSDSLHSSSFLTTF